MLALTGWNHILECIKLYVTKSAQYDDFEFILFFTKITPYLLYLMQLPHKIITDQYGQYENKVDNISYQKGPMHFCHKSNIIGVKWGSM